MNIEQIREDLRDIRYYYSMQSVFDNGAKKVRSNSTMEKVEKYNKIMANAPSKLYVLYVSLYLENNSQTSLSDRWCYTRDYIKDLNNKLCEYLLDVLSKLESEGKNG